MVAHQPLPPRERILEAAGKRWTIEPWIGRWWWRWDRSHGSTFLFLAISSSFFHGLVDPPHGKEKWAVRPKVWLVHAAVNLSFSFRTPSIFTHAAVNLSGFFFLTFLFIRHNRWRILWPTGVWIGWWKRWNFFESFHDNYHPEDWILRALPHPSAHTTTQPLFLGVNLLSREGYSQAGDRMRKTPGWEES